MAKNYRLIDAIAESGLNFCSLARKTGVDRKTIMRCAHGSTPKVDTAILIAMELGKSVEDIWDADARSTYEGA